MLNRRAWLSFLVFVFGLVGWACAGGTVVETDPPDTCESPLADCGDDCVDLTADPANCGACGVSCTADEACIGGDCQGCSAPLTACDGSCVDTATDPLNCGACGLACLDGQQCLGAMCRCPQNTPNLCGSECVNISLDPQHCGGCGNACDPGQVCNGSVCAADCGTLTDCNGSCVNLSSDMAHCGFCNNACDPVSEICQSGQCQCIPGLCGACGVSDIGNSVPQTVSGTTVGAPDVLTPSCQTGGPERAFTFTAPNTGEYIFHTQGSSFDTVLSVRSAGCIELACNDDSGFDLTSSVVVSLSAGEQVLAIVEGFQGEFGSFNLHVVEAPPCPGTDLGSTVPNTVAGSNVGLPNVYVDSCYPFDIGEASYEFTAPTSDSYAFSVTPSNFDVLLSVLDASCGGITLGCDEGFGSVTATAIVPLVQNQTVVVMVDGAGSQGAFQLDIDVAPPCPSQSLGSTVPQVVSGSTVSAPNILQPPCSGSNAPEATYGFTAPAAGTYVFSTAGSSFDTSLAVYDGDCYGTLLSCADGFGIQDAVGVTLAAGQTVAVVVDGDMAGSYSLSVDNAPACPALSLGSTSPQTVTGTTAGQLSIYDPSCGSPGSPEVAYSFTAPANGTYTFDTFGSVYDTVLYVRDGGCGGSELACNDDETITFTLQSQLSVVLTMGQTVTVFVDGFGGDFGNYTLNVSGP